MFLIGDNFLLILFAIGALAYAYFSFVLGFSLALWLYGPSYFDKSEAKGGREWPWMRRWKLWKSCRRCYRHRIIDHGFINTLEPKHPRPVLFACSPHGVNAVSFFFTFLVDHGAMSAWLGRPYGAVFNLMLWIPGIRELFLAMGCVNVNRETILRLLLKEGRNVALIPGGTREIAPVNGEEVRRRRLGFLRLFHGAEGRFDLSYVHMENEDRVYWTWGDRLAIRQWLLDRLGFTITPYAGALPTHPLLTHIGPRFRYRRGESWEALVERWFAYADSMRPASLPGAPARHPWDHEGTGDMGPLDNVDTPILLPSPETKRWAASDFDKED